MNTVDVINKMLVERAKDFRKTKDGENYNEVPEFKAGDMLEVSVRVIEGEKERIQKFKGIVLGKRGSDVNQTFRIRKISNGVGVERVFPLFSPMIQNISVVKEGRSRRAKLYYLRGMSEKKIRQKISKNSKVKK